MIIGYRNQGEVGEVEMGGSCLMGKRGLFVVMIRFGKIIITMDIHIVTVVNSTESLTLKWQIFIIYLFGHNFTN